MSAPRGRVVSFDDEPLIVVDEKNEVVGYRSKADCHAGDGILHRAFSVFLFDEGGHLLLQQRSASKPLWPLVWSNSCCSHPRRGETEAEAASRRLQEELGVDCPLEFLFQFQYHARFGSKGSEHELCSVFLGRLAGEVRPNEEEIADIRFLHVDELEDELAEEPDEFSPWLRLEWRRMRDEHWDRVQPYTSGG